MDEHEEFYVLARTSPNKVYNKKARKLKTYPSYSVSIPTKIAKIFELSNGQSLKLTYSLFTKEPYISIWRKPFKKGYAKKVLEKLEKDKIKRMQSSRDIQIYRELIPAAKKKIKHLESGIEIEKGQEKKSSSHLKYLKRKRVKKGWDYSADFQNTQSDIRIHKQTISASKQEIEEELKKIKKLQEESESIKKKRRMNQLG